MYSCLHIFQYKIVRKRNFDTCGLSKNIFKNCSNKTNRQLDFELIQLTDLLYLVNMVFQDPFDDLLFVMFLFTICLTILCEVNIYLIFILITYYLLTLTFNPTNRALFAKWLISMISQILQHYRQSRLNIIVFLKYRFLE